jgi:hypothetical protein
MFNKEPRNDSKESILPAFVAWWARTSNRVVVPACQAGNLFLGSIKGLQIRALYNNNNSNQKSLVHVTITSRERQSFKKYSESVVNDVKKHVLSNADIKKLICPDGHFLRFPVFD